MSSPAVVTTRCSTEAKALFVDGGIVSRKRLACFPLQQMYLSALPAGLQRLEKNHKGEILVVPGLNGLSNKKEGPDKVIAPL